MKKVVLMFLFSVFFISCSNNDSPEQVAKNFLTHLNKGEMNKAKEYSTKKSAKFLTLLDNIIQEMSDEKRKKLEEQSIEITIIKTEVDGDNAKVFYEVKEGEEKEKSAQDDKQDVLKLVKEESKWKVDFSKKEEGKEAPLGEDDQEELENTDNGEAFEGVETSVLEDEPQKS